MFESDSRSRRRVLRSGIVTAGTLALGSVAGCLRGSTGPERISYPLDRDDPRVQAARSAEARAYEHYGLEYTEHFIDVESLGGQIRVLSVGAGSPVVLIPGGVGHGFTWLPLLSELEDYTVYVMDRPGGGLSDGIDHRALPLRAIAARSTAALFDHFDLDAAPLVGNSMGGLWCIRFALEHPNRTSMIVQLGCPALYPGMSAPLPMRAMSVPGIGEILVDRMMQPESVEAAREGLDFLGHPDETKERLPSELFEASYRMDNLPHFKRSWASLLQRTLRFRGTAPEPALAPDDLRDIRSPVQLLWGSNDPFGSVSTGQSGAEYFRDAEFHEVGVGHLPWFDDQATCGELVRDFIERHG